jgi:hypothetical protein
MTLLVVGAGPSGLSAIRALVEAGRDVVGVERHTDVGGIWDIENPGTPMYESAHLISSRTQSALDGLPMPEDYPDYPSHRQLHAYLRDFADHFDLRRHIRFGVAVEQLEPHDGGAWTAHLSDGTTQQAEAVVLAVGNQWHPNLPDLPGTFTGEAFHSQAYRDPEVFRGRRVLVVGAGNSGCDIACDAAQVASWAALSTRRGYRFVPKYIFGQPTDVFAHRGPSLPAPLEQKLLTRLLDLVVGDVTRFGLPAPDHDVLGTHPIMNTQVLDHLGHGDLVARPDVASLDGPVVHFVDGTAEDVDVIVWATGYRPTFPMLPEGVVDWHGINPNLYLNLFHRDRDDLFVMGMIETDASAWPHISLQARLVAAALDVADRDPTQAAAFARLKHTDADLEGGLRHVDSPRHSYYQRNATYLALARELLRQLTEGEVTGEPLAVGAGPATRRTLRRVVRQLPLATR